MKNDGFVFCLRRVWCFFLILILSVPARGTTDFQIVWGMDQTLSGASSSTNFNPSDAVLTGASPHSLQSIRYYSIGATDWAYGTTSWQATGAEKYLSFAFSVSTFEYSISSVSFRVRRSATGPVNVSLRSSMDGFASDLSTFNLSADGTFYQVSVPLGLTGLTSGLTFRLYGLSPSNGFGVLYFDQIVIAGTVTSIVLPVNLTLFSAQVREKAVQLDWETAWEQNTGKFIVERSADMDKFGAIGEVAASGTSVEKTPYRFVDETPEHGINYYRLRLVDQNGAYSFSKIVEAIISTGQAGFTVSPNPASPSTIRIKTGMETPEEMILANLSGRRVPIVSTARTGNFMDLFPNHTLCSGIYVLSLRYRGRWLYQKVLIP